MEEQLKKLLEVIETQTNGILPNSKFTCDYTIGYSTINLGEYHGIVFCTFVDSKGKLQKLRYTRASNAEGPNNTSKNQKEDVLGSLYRGVVTNLLYGLNKINLFEIVSENEPIPDFMKLKELPTYEKTN